MLKLLAVAAALAAPVLAGAPVAAGPGRETPPEIAHAFNRLYNFDFAGAHRILDGYIAIEPEDPLPYAVRSAAYLFYELDRLGILESQFFANDKRIADKKKLNPDPRVREQMFQAIEAAQSRAQAVLTRNPSDANAMFAMCVTLGITTDYMALVEKRQLGSLSVVKKNNVWAQKLLKLNPPCYDAYVTTGVAEYLVGSLPFFVRWFVHFDNVEGSKEQAIRNLQSTVEKGRYLGPFAKILLGIIYLREKQPQQTERLLQELSRDFPENRLYRQELARVMMHSNAAQ